MAEPIAATAVKPICGMLSADVALFDVVAAALAEAFGPADVSSDVLPFDFTHYYDDQMGTPLWRKFIAFRRLAEPDFLAEAKRRTNALECDIASRSGGCPPRPVNLDVGYVAPSKLVLASMKDFAHRVYLGGGVYAEVTLVFVHGRWQKMPWTFPDYASGRYDAFLTAVRETLRRRKRQEKPT